MARHNRLRPCRRFAETFRGVITQLVACARSRCLPAIVGDTLIASCQQVRSRASFDESESASQAVHARSLDELGRLKQMNAGGIRDR
jgi:hypothetical protein